MNYELIDLLRKKPSIALIGATNNSFKFGNTIFKFLVKRDFIVFPINHKATTVEGVKAYKNLSDTLEKNKIDLLVYVIPPKLTLESLQEAKSLQLKNIWIQPGAANQEVEEFLIKNKFNYLLDHCVMTLL